MTFLYIAELGNGNSAVSLVTDLGERARPFFSI